MTGLISSAANPVVKRLRLLGDRKHRRREGAFVVEGIQPVWQAVEAGADVEVLVVAPALLGSRTAEMVAGQEAAGAAGVVLVGAAADPFDPAAVKASMGALFAVPVARAADAAEFLAWAAGS